MPITLFLITLISATTQTTDSLTCDEVPKACHNRSMSWVRCFEDNIVDCSSTRSTSRNRISEWGSSSQSISMAFRSGHQVHIPSSAFKRSGLNVVGTTVSSENFKLAQKGSVRKLNQPPRMDGLVMGELVVAVTTENYTLINLEDPIKLTFKRNTEVTNGTCVFWHVLYPVDGSGYWSTEGCNTSCSGAEFLCSCNHLSFFAVLVNPALKVDESNATHLSYLNYIGSALTVLLTIITLIVYICLQRKRPEKAIGVHMHLTGALLCLHLSFLLCSYWVWLLDDEEEDRVCQAFGLFLHWSLLASITWMALEGFHLYLLLVRVFNIYVRRYLLKLSVVGWGFPTLVAAVCGFSGVYGKYKLELSDSNHNLTMCWMSSQFPQKLNVVSYITVVGFPFLVILGNSCMLGIVVFKLWGLRRGHGGSSSWSKTHKEKGTQLWKDCATVVGLSFVLGLPWGLAATTYISVTGIYIFTILNSLQGVFIFLWSVALTCKSRDDNNSSVRDPSMQKMMTTSFNN